MSSVAQILSRFRIGKPSCSTLFALQLLNDATKSMAISAELRQVIYTVSLTQGVREYILDPQIFLIKEAYWVRSSSPGDQQVLYQTSDDQLAIERVGWRGFSWSGQSYNCYVATTSANNATVPATASTITPGSAMVLGFDPPPNITTIGGYPCVQLYATTWIAFTINDYLPDHLGPDDLWIDKLETLYCKAHNLQEVATRTQLAAMSHQETVSRIKNTELGVQTTIIPGFVNRRRRI